MIRRKGGFSLSEAQAEVEEEGVNPMHHVPNLPDVFLVLAVGLLIALIGHWNVDVASSTGALDTDKLTQVEGDLNSGEAVAQSALAGDSFEAVGTVYRDTTTNELYLLSE